MITQRDKRKHRGLKKQSSELKRFAESVHLPYWTKSSFEDKDFFKQIHDLELDFCFVCAFGKILPLSFLNLFPDRCFNLHFSLLPRWRGAAPIQRALMSGDLETGVSLQVMTEELDAGDLIASQSFSIEKDDHSLSLFEKAFQVTEVLLGSSLLSYLKGEIQASPQGSQGLSYAKKIDKSLARLDWEEESLLIHNKVRALYLGPQMFCFFEEGKKRLKIYQSRINTQVDTTGFCPGEICQRDKKKLSITCGKGALDLLEVQKEGKKRQNIQDFLSGHFLKQGDRFS